VSIRLQAGFTSTVGLGGDFMDFIVVSTPAEVLLKSEANKFFFPHVPSPTSNAHSKTEKDFGCSATIGWTKDDYSL